jgi:hypothetical protein
MDAHEELAKGVATGMDARSVRFLDALSIPTPTR